MEIDNIVNLPKLKSNYCKGHFLIKPEQKKFISETAKEKSEKSEKRISQNEVVRDILERVMQNEN